MGRVKGDDFLSQVKPELMVGICAGRGPLTRPSAVTTESPRLRLRSSKRSEPEVKLNLKSKRKQAAERMNRHKQAALTAVKDDSHRTELRKSPRRNVASSPIPEIKKPASPEPGRRLTRHAVAEKSRIHRDLATSRPVRRRRAPPVDPLLEPVTRRRRVSLATAASLIAAAEAAEEAAMVAAAEAADAKAVARAAACENGEGTGSAAARGLEEDLACPICSELLVRKLECSMCRTPIQSGKQGRSGGS